MGPVWLFILFTWSIGSNERIHRGKNSQFFNILGSHPGFFVCKTLITITMKRVVSSGTATMNNTVVPATDNPKQEMKSNLITYGQVLLNYSSSEKNDGTKNNKPYPLLHPV